MPTVTLTSKNFEEYVKQGGALVVDWWAPWCGPCKVFAPIFEQASDRMGDVTFAKINTDEEPDLAGSFQISAIPTLMVFRDQILIFEQAGVLRADALDELIGKVKALDMEEVRREVAKQEEAHARGEHEQGEERGEPG